MRPLGLRTMQDRPVDLFAPLVGPGRPVVEGREEIAPLPRLPNR